jgi:hypothetical protein
LAAAAAFAACPWANCRAEAFDDLLACRSIEEPQARLACFDRESAALAGHERPPAADLRPGPAPVATPAPDPERQFGLTDRAVAQQEVAAGARAADAPRIEAHVMRLSAGAGGRVVFELDNDQVWRQVIADGELLLNKGDAVSIARAALGSYWLSTPTGRGCRVTRVR